MSDIENTPSDTSPTPDISPELSRELHPSRGLDSDAVKHIVQLAHRKAIVERSKRAVRGGRWTEYTQLIIDERRKQKEERGD